MLPTIFRVPLASGTLPLGDSAGEMQPITLTGDVTVNNTGVTALAAQILNGADVADTANINVIGGIPVLFRINTASGATNTVNVTTTHKIRVIDVWCVCTSAGSAAATLQVLSTGNAITDAMDVNDADEIISRAASINDANHEIAAGGVIRVTMTDAGADGPAVTTYVLAVRVA